MRQIKHKYKLIILLFTILQANSQLPAGFQVSKFVDFGGIITSFKFLPNGIVYGTLKQGVILWASSNGSSKGVILDISQEVLDAGDSGLQNMCLDPDFASNGYFYIYYVLDYNYFINNLGSLDNSTTGFPTIGRLVRYQADIQNDFKSLVPNSKTYIIGQTLTDGIPLFSIFHQGGGLAFGNDSHLYLATGDSDIYTTTNNANYPQFHDAVNRGIITNEQRAGTYRTQFNESLNGKILRLNPNNGEGINDNPYFQPNLPKSALSRMYSKGLRNPWRLINIAPSESSTPQFLVSDVGNNKMEELNLISTPNQNFGWPYYEGLIIPNLYMPEIYRPTSYNKPVFEFRGNTMNKIINDTQITVSGSFHSGGYCVSGIAHYKNQDFPAEYKNNVFVSDFTGKWIGRIKFNLDGTVNQTSKFYTSNHQITDVQVSTLSQGLFYSESGSIWKINYGGSINKTPEAKILVDRTSGNSPLTTSFNGEMSYDPENSSLTYFWEFGDGTTSTGISPHHQFVNSTKSKYKVKLTVTDPLGLKSKDSVNIFINNNPPKIISTSIDSLSVVNLNNDYPVSLQADVADDEGPLLITWKVYLNHNGHKHLESTFNGQIFNTNLTALNCSESATYWYEIELLLADISGQTKTFSKYIYNNCGKNTQNISAMIIPDLPTNFVSHAISANSTSGLPLSFYHIKGPILLQNNIFTPLNSYPGPVQIRAIQHGDSNYEAARPVDISFNLYRNMSSQTVSVSPISPKSTLDPPFSITSSASSGLATSCLVLSGPASINNKLISLNGTPGVVSLRCYQEGNHLLKGAYFDTSFDVLGCYPKIVFTDPTTLFNVSNLFKSYGEINNHSLLKLDLSNVIFQSEKYIELSPGFTVENGSIFSAQIGNCLD